VDHALPGAEDRLAEQLDARFGPLTALVNSVGRRHNDLIGDLDRDTLLETMSLNVVSHMLLTQRLVPLFAGGAGAGGGAGTAGAGNGGGAVVNISSRLARVGMPGVSGYAATKGALNSFTVAAAVELAPLGIRVNAVAPGMTRTPLIDAWLGEQPDAVAAEAEVTGRIPLARLAAPDDVAGAVVFLASPESSYITGAVLPVDGGYTIG
jgi:NAD(P)-dependent dehydrogenase (short-subunit alcohol dehydrogenase family)